MTAPLLEVSDLVKHFPDRAGTVRAVDGISFEIGSGETLSLVGESGCGKTTTGRLVVRLIEATSGSVRLEGVELTTLGRAELRMARRSCQFIFQDPFGSLNPRMTVGDIIAEPLETAGGMERANRRRRVDELLQIVGLTPGHARRHPHEFSGGQRQRIGIARALALRPKFIVCDEPVSALDVSVRAQVINLMRSLQREFGLTYLFIAHDLAVVRHISDRVAVMYLGQIVEIGHKRSLFVHPRHPYTRALMAAVPVPDPTRARTRVTLAGEAPSPLDPPAGCRFHTRCPQVTERCRRVAPALRPVEQGHQVACHLA
jgi:oligopeptide/dipeptide ABC transporter ATP-binding protein